MAAKPIFVQAVDTNGTPYSGAKLNVYDAGTTTPRAIYAESGLGTASANPAIADANGVVVVWVNDAGGDIKVTLTNSAETVTPHNEDNVPIASLTCYPVITFQGDQSLLTTSIPTFAGLTLGNVSFAGVVTDPNADRLVFWDDSAGQVNFMTLGTGLAFNGTALELDGDLQDISGLTPTDGGVIIGDGTDFVVESGGTLRTSLGVAVGSDVLAYDANLQAFVDAFTAPTSDGSAGQYLKTDGAGNLAFDTPSGGGDLLSTATEYAPGDLYYAGDLLGSASATSVVSSLPGSPSEKDVHILDTAAGGFAANSIIVYVGGSWRERVPHEGEAIFVEGDNRTYQYTSGKAARFSFRLIDPNTSTGSISAITINGVNGLASAVNRSSYASDDLFYSGVESGFSLTGYAISRVDGLFTVTASTVGESNNALTSSITTTDIELNVETGETFGGEDASWKPSHPVATGDWSSGRAPAIIDRSKPRLLTPEMYIGLDTQIVYAPGGLNTDYSGATDFAPAFSAMREEILENLVLSEWPPTDNDATIPFRGINTAVGFQPGLRYRTSAPINLTNMQAVGAKLFGNGATIAADHSGGACVDLIGSRGWALHDLRIETDSSSRPQFGILYGRDNATRTCNDIDIISCHVDGWFVKSALGNFASETNNIVGGRFINWNSTGTDPNGSINALWIDSENRMDVASATLAEGLSGLDSVAISAISQQSTAVINAISHGFSNGDRVGVYDVSGMTEINWLEGTVASASANFFQLSGVDSTGFTAYASGGRAHKLVNASCITHAITGSSLRNVSASNYGALRIDSSPTQAGSSVQDISLTGTYIQSSGNSTTEIHPAAYIRGSGDDIRLEGSFEKQSASDGIRQVTHDVYFDTRDGNQELHGFKVVNHLSDGELATIDKSDDSNTLSLHGAEIRIARRRGAFSGANSKLFGDNASNMFVTGHISVGDDADLQDLTRVGRFSGTFETAAAVSGVSLSDAGRVSVVSSSSSSGGFAKLSMKTEDISGAADLDVGGYDVVSITDTLTVGRIATITSVASDREFTLVNTSGADLRLDFLTEEIQLRDNESVKVTNVSGVYYGPQRAVSKVHLTASDAFLGTSTPPALTAQGSLEIPALSYDDTTNERANFVFRCPDSWKGKSITDITAQYTTAASQSANDIRWTVEIGHSDLANFTGGLSISTAFNVSGAASATELVESTMTLPSPLSIGAGAAGQTISLRVTRSAANAADTVVGDANLVGLVIRAV